MGWARPWPSYAPAGRAAQPLAKAGVPAASRSSYLTPGSAARHHGAMKISALSIVPLLASSALLLPTGCGGDGTSCGTAACGGDPVGTGNIEGVCFNAEIEPPEECPEARITTDFDITGTLTVNADET